QIEREAAACERLRDHLLQRSHTEDRQFDVHCLYLAAQLSGRDRGKGGSPDEDREGVAGALVDGEVEVRRVRSVESLGLDGAYDPDDGHPARLTGATHIDAFAKRVLVLPVA